jgi:tetratricopeptide (TPR) repeat protein
LVPGVLAESFTPEEAADADEHWRPMTLLACFIIFLGMLGAYCNAFVSGMALDNKYIIEEYYHDTPAIDPRIPIASLKFAEYQFVHDYWWPKGISGLFRPLTSWSYWLNYVYRENRLDPLRYHVVNLVLHWMTATLVFALVRRLSRRYWAALLAGLIFAVHPVATESVTNIIGRADILAALTTLAGTLCYIRATRYRTYDDELEPYLFAFLSEAFLVLGTVLISIVVWQVSAPTSHVTPGLEYLAAAAAFIGLCSIVFCVLDQVFGTGGSAWWMAALFAISAIGVFSKESGVTVAAGVLLYELVMRTNFRKPYFFEDARNTLINLLRGAAVMGAVFFFMFVVRRYVYITSTPPEEPFLDNPIRGQTFITGRMTAVDVAGRLFSKLLWPIHLSADYSWNQIPLFTLNGVSPQWMMTPGWHNWEAVLWLLFFIAVLVFAGWVYTRNRAVCYFILFYFCGYAPTANILKVIGSIMAERFMYMPLIGFAGAAGLGIDWLARRADRALATTPSDDKQEEAEKGADAAAGGRAVGASAGPNRDDVRGPADGAIDYARGLAPQSRSYLDDPSDAPESGAWPGFGRVGWLPYVAALVVVCLFSVRSFYRNFDWHDDISLFTSGVRECPLSFRCYQSLAFAYLEELGSMPVEEQKPPVSPRVEKMIDRLYQTAEHALPIVDVLPPDKDSSRLYLHLGMYYTRKADSLCTFARDGTPIDNDQSRYWLAKAVDVLRRGEEVDKAFNDGNRAKDIARGTNPDQIADTGMNFLYQVLGPDLIRLGRYTEGMEALQYSVHLAPTDIQSMGQMFNVQIRLNHLPAAAVIAVRILLLHPEQKDVWSLLGRVMNQINPANRGLTNGKLNINDPTARAILFQAYREEIWQLYQAKWYTEARKLRQVAIDVCRYPPQAFPSSTDLDKVDPIR